MEACRVLTISYSFCLGLYGVLHEFFRRSQILLTFSRNQVMVKTEAHVSLDANEVGGMKLFYK